MPIPSYADWIEYTKLDLFHPRSSKLSAVDRAVDAYSRDGRDPMVRGRLVSAIRVALQEWSVDRGGDCTKSSRNKPPRYIVTELVKAVNEQPLFSADELQAFTYLEQERRKQVQAIFRDKRICWKMCNTQMELKAAHTDLKRAESAAIQQFGSRDKWLERMRPGPAAAARTGLAVTGVSGDIARLARNGLPTGSAANNFGLQGASHLGGDLQLHQTRDAFNGMMGDLFGGRSLSSISADLTRGIGMDIHQLGADVIPIVSNIVSGARLLLAWGQAARLAWQQSATLHHEAFLSGANDIKAAFDALNSLLERRANAALLDASIQSVDFASRTALSFADLGAASSAVVGIVSKISKLVHKLYLFARELAEKSRADVILADQSKLGLELFEVYPLLGCYMLCCSDTSSLIALSHSIAVKGGVPFGGQGWMYDVEYLKKTHLDPVLKRAVYFINASPFYIPNMPMHVKYNPDMFDKAAWGMNQVSALGNVISTVRGGT